VRYIGYTQHFERAGLIAVDSVPNLGLNVLVIALAFVMIPVSALFLKNCKTRLPRISQLVRGYFLYSFLYRFLMEQSLYLNVVIMVQFYHFKFDNLITSTSAVLSTILASVLFTFPFVQFYNLYRNRNKLNDKDFKARHGSLYEHVQPQGKGPAITVFLFFMRRMLFGVIAVFLSKYPTL